MQVFLKILETLSRKGKIIWAVSVALGILASILEVASAANTTGHKKTLELTTVG